MSSCLDLCTRHHEADAAAGNSNMVEALSLAQVWAAVTCCSCTLRKWGLEQSVFPEQANINKSICNAALLLKYAQTLTVNSNGPGGLFVFTSWKVSLWPECRCHFCSAGWNQALHTHQQHHTSSDVTNRSYPAGKESVGSEPEPGQCCWLQLSLHCSVYLKYISHTEEICIYWWCNSLLKWEGR